MRVLIVGAYGQVGKELTHAASQHNYHVIAASHSDLDICQLKNIKHFIQKHNPDIIINAAAYTAVDKAEEDQELAYSINRDGASHLASVCAKNNIPLLHISTDYVFNGAKEGAYKEKDTVSPLGIYGDSKLQGEEAIRKQLHAHIILRVAWVFSAHGNNFVKSMLSLAKDNNELNIVADQYGGPSPAQDIAKTLISLVNIYEKNKKLQWGTYHYCGEKKTSWYHFAKEIFKQADKLDIIKNKIKVNAITTAEYPTKAQRPLNSMLNCEKIKNIYAIEMPDWKKSLHEILLELK